MVAADELAAKAKLAFVGAAYHYFGLTLTDSHDLLAVSVFEHFDTQNGVI